MNQLSNQEVAKAAKAVKETMQDASQNNMNKAASELGKAAESAGKSAESKDSQKSQAASEAGKSAKSAQAQQGEAIAKMEDAKKQLDAFDSTHEVKRKLDELIGRENEFKKDIENAKTPTGAKREELTKDQRDELDKAAKKQDEIQKETSELMDKMGKMADKSQNDAEKKALEASKKAGDDAKVTDSQGKAGSQAKANEKSNASSSAGSASAGMQKMKDELENISKYKLDTLSQQLAELLAQLEKIKKDEEAIEADTTKAGDKATEEELKPTWNNQGRNHMQTVAAQKAAEAVREMRPVAPIIQSAAGVHVHRGGGAGTGEADGGVARRSRGDQRAQPGD